MFPQASCRCGSTGRLIEIMRIILAMLAWVSNAVDPAIVSLWLLRARTQDAPHWTRTELPPAVRGGDRRGLVVRGAPALQSAPQHGGTACHCICGDRVVWHRRVFPGNVKAEKENQCEQEICPMIIIPGLRVYADCTYAADLTNLIAGTLCQCQCGDRLAWRDRGFYGNVTAEKEQECLEEVCPRVNPLPGLRYEANCRFDPKLFALPDARKAHVKAAAFGGRLDCAILLSAMALAALGWTTTLGDTR